MITKRRQSFCHLDLDMFLQNSIGADLYFGSKPSSLIPLLEKVYPHLFFWKHNAHILKDKTDINLLSGQTELRLCQFWTSASQSQGCEKNKYSLICKNSRKCIRIEILENLPISLVSLIFVNCSRQKFCLHMSTGLHMCTFSD